MIFTRRHERDLAEIKALNQELDKSVQEALKQLRGIREVQRQASSGGDGQVADPPVAFVHIPKTAGASVTTMFARAYSRAEIYDAGNYLKDAERTVAKLARQRVANARLTVGHVPYGLLRQHLPEDTRYLTFLREPVDRVLSHYYRHIHTEHRRRAARYAPELWDPERGGIVKTTSIEQALVEVRLPQISNLATRFLSGYPAPPMTAELPATALDDAKESLRGFAFVGIQERFAESLVLLQRMLGLGSIPYRDRHVSFGDGRPAVDEIPDGQRALIEESNRLDSELYAFAMELFEDAVAAAGDELAADMEALRILNEAAVEEDQAALEAACDWLERELPPGSTVPVAALRAAAERAGISGPAGLLPRACKRLGIKEGVDHQAGQRVWTRPGEADKP